MRKRPSELRPEWEALQKEAATLAAQGMALRGLHARHPKVLAQEAAVAAVSAKKEMLAAAAWLGEARDLPDLLMLAELAWDFNWGVGTFPDVPPSVLEHGDESEVAVAMLIRGVFDASKSAADGRNA